jgi:hypothetical protein
MTVTNSYNPVLSPTPAPIITIPKTGGSRGDMTVYGVFTLINLMAFAGMQILAVAEVSTAFIMVYLLSGSNHAVTRDGFIDKRHRLKRNSPQLSKKSVNPGEKC